MLYLSILSAPITPTVPAPRHISYTKFTIHHSAEFFFSEWQNFNFLFLGTLCTSLPYVKTGLIIVVLYVFNCAPLDSNIERNTLDSPQNGLLATFNAILISNAVSLLTDIS